MSEKLLKLFVKDYKNTESTAVRTACTVAAGWVCIACNIILCAAKLTIGLISRSIAIQADAVNNLSDIGSSAGIIFGAKAAAKPADREHPYGHGRLEYIVSLAIAFLVLMVGFSLAREAIGKIIEPESVDYSIAMLIVLALSIVVKLWMGYFTSGVGRHINSSAMSAAAADSVSDVVATGAILISSLVGYFFNINTDGYISLAAALFVIYSGIGIIRSVIGPLLGAAPDKETIIALKDLLMTYDGIIGVHDILIHSYGPGKTIASAHAEVRADCDLIQTHEIIDRAEREVGQKLDMLLTLHMDPIETNNKKLDRAREIVADVIENIDPSVHFHDFRMVSGEKTVNLIFDIVVSANTSEKEAESIRKRICEETREINPAFRCVITIDYDYTGN
jgi:cation diffusion facilitator family transporter